MIRSLILLISLFAITSALCQTATLLADNFENGLANWTLTDDLLPNYWIDTTCAGNGPSEAGNMSMYISPGGPDAGCGATGEIQHSYVNSSGGVLMATAYANIDATCSANIDLTFDYKIEGVSTEDFGEVIYSIDGGASWLPISGELTMSATWTTATYSLPGALGGTNFLLGFRFTYNDATVNGIPLAIDNVLVEGEDTTPPSMVCPTSIDEQTTSSCIAYADDYAKLILFLSDNCTDSADIVFTQVVPEFTPFGSGPGGSEIITITAYDEAGNSTQCDVTINIVDELIPVISCPSDTTVYVDGSCNGALEDYSGDVIASDNCTTFGNLIIDQSPASGTIISGAGVSTLITITVSDESGNDDFCSFSAVTIDTTGATIICPSDTILYADVNCQASIEDYTGEAIIADNCVSIGSLIVTQSPVPGTTIVADEVITLTVNDGGPGAQQSCSFNAIFVDTIPPSIVCPIPVDMYLDATCEVLMLDYTSSIVINDNCGLPIVTQSPAPGTTITGVGDITVTMYVTDASGNIDSCQITQAVMDTISPSITCPGDQTEEGDNNCQAVIGDYSSLASTMDNCSGVINLVQNPIAGTTISGPTVVTLTATDLSGNSSSCTFNVTIDDVLPPDITCPGTQTANVDVNCEYTLQDFTSMVSATDNCSAAINMTYSQSPIPGNVLNSGSNTITITVTDEAGNSSDCSFTLDILDQIDPTINCPGNQILYADGNCEGSIGDYSSLAVVSDNCSTAGNITIQQSPNPGTAVSTDTQITLTAMDEGGNTSSCSFFVILTDTISPVVNCPIDQTLAINSSCEYTVPDLSGLVSGADNCSMLSNMTIGQNPAAGSTQSGITAVLITLTDQQGNSNSCITTLLPDDQDPPTITCPNPAPIDNGTLCDYTLSNYASMASVLDNCSNYTIQQDPPVGSTISTGNNVITLTVTDAGGNTDECNFTLIVTENVDPTINCPSNISTCDPVVNFAFPSFSDNCEVSLIQTDVTGLTSGMTFPIGITTLEYMAVDSSGNNATCSFNIEVLEYPSSANIPDDTISICDENSMILTADAITSGSGEWTLLSGQGVFNNQFASTTGVNNLGIGVNVFVWTVSSPTCGSLSDTVIVINTQQDVPASTQDTLYTCNNPLVILQSSTPLNGTGTWTTNGLANIADVNSSNTTATIITSGWQEFVWTIENGGCPSTSDTMFVLANLDPYIYTPDTSLCLEDGVLNIVATEPADGQSSGWYVSSGDAVITYADSSQAIASSFGLGMNFLVYSSEAEGCPATYDTLLIIGTLCEGYDPILPTVITPNFDGKNDLFEIAYLEQLYPECHVTIFNRWGSVVFESAGYQDAWDGTYKGEPLPMGTYFYKVELNDEESTVLQGDISIIR